MIGVRIKLDVRAVKRELDRARKEIVPKAMAASMNRAAESVATTASREIAKATKIPVRKVRERLKVTRATPARLIAEVQAFPYAPNLGKYGRPTQNKAGTAATAWERRKTYRGAFKYRGTDRVVSRVGKARFPLKGLRGPSVRRTFMQKRILVKLEAVARQVWRDRLTRELARRSRS